MTVKEGTALVDLGTGVFGERPWSDVRTLTQQRQADIQHLRDELKVQSDQTEVSLGQAAQSFNRLAEQLKETPAPEPAPSEPSGETESTPAEQGQRRPRRRSMFGGDLTLDD